MTSSAIWWLDLPFVDLWRSVICVFGDRFSEARQCFTLLGSLHARRDHLKNAYTATVLHDLVRATFETCVLPLSVNR